MEIKNEDTTIKITKRNFWELEGYRVLHKLSSKDKAIEKLLGDSKNE